MNKSTRRTKDPNPRDPQINPYTLNSQREERGATTRHEGGNQNHRKKMTLKRKEKTEGKKEKQINTHVHVHFHAGCTR